ncbi:MAG: ribose-phosphate pyrophosphokinase [Phycisphaerae bacterium]|nr:ribose-phosphate pyrophosphokinase [Phycisphaerae bacterium]
MNDKPLLIFSGSSNPELTQAICDYLGMPMGVAKIDKFPDSEKIIKVDTDVRGKDCYVVQTTSAPVDSMLMELLIFLDCLKRASAARVTAVIPYFGYARQDRKDAGRVPITAKLVANLITTAGADRVLSIDLHAKQLQGFFDIPVDHLSASPVFVQYLKDKQIEDLTVVAPDVGNMKTASLYASALKAELAIIHKRRISGNLIECTEIIGRVEGRNIVMCDDMISTAGTICGAAQLVRQRGAKRIIAGATHGVFAGPALERLQQAPFDEVLVTDTIALPEEARQMNKLTILTVSSLLGEAIRRIHMNESVSGMFEEGT